VHRYGDQAKGLYRWRLLRPHYCVGSAQSQQQSTLSWWKRLFFIHAHANTRFGHTVGTVLWQICLFPQARYFKDVYRVEHELVSIQGQTLTRLSMLTQVSALFRLSCLMPRATMFTIPIRPHRRRTTTCPCLHQTTLWRTSSASPWARLINLVFVYVVNYFASQIKSTNVCTRHTRP